MQRLLLLLGIICSLNVHAQSDLPLAYLQNFDGSSTEFVMDSENDNLIYLENGRYHIDRKKHDEASTYYWGNPMIDFNEDYDIETMVRYEGGAIKYGFGICFGAKNIDNSYAFTITISGYAILSRYKEGNYEKITDWMKLAEGTIHLQGEDNFLQVRKRGTKLSFFVNRILVHEMNDPGSFGPSVALIATDVMHISVDYMQFFQKVTTINLIDNAVKGYVKENLGVNVNSATDEYNPVISADGNILYFTRAHHPQNLEDYEDIWVTVKDNTGNWIPALRFNHPINNDGNNAIYNVSPDGNFMLVSNVYHASGNSISGNGVSLAIKPDNKWRVPQEVKIKKFKHKKGGFYNFFLSATGKELLMSIENPSAGIGGNDLYVSFQEGDYFSEPVNLGKTINTLDDEAAPFLSPDGVTLYFASRGLKGYGGDDIYMTKRLDDTWQNWSEPKNLGPEINSTSQDTDFRIDAKGEYAYVVSTKHSIGVKDIFKIKLSEGAKPEPLVLITGKVYNAKTKEPLGAKITYFDLNTNKEIGYALSTTPDGVYRIALPKGKFYSFFASSEKFYAVSENIDLLKLEQYTEITRDLYLTPIEQGKSIRLNNVFFEFNQALLKDESKAELDRLLEVLMNNKSLKIEIGGHTDNVGEKLYNQELSGKRAQAVVDYLTSKGIESQRLTSAGYGDTQPATLNTTDEGRQFNRRVEFKIVKM
jgi:outer membrane protein OmpA-like peptidoglycan-associated protein